MTNDQWMSPCGRITLIHGDGREHANNIDTDSLITDPPYGMNWDTDNTRFSGGNQRRSADSRRCADWGGPIHGDDEPFDPTPWLGYRHVCLWGANHYAQRLPIGTTLVWIKKYDPAFGTFLSDAEIAWVKGGHGVYCQRDCGMNGAGANMPKHHPTEKSVKIMIWCMDRARVPADALVYDPYMGSATTAIACLRTGRRFIGREIIRRYFEAAVRRVAADIDQTAILSSPAPAPLTLDIGH